MLLQTRDFGVIEIAEDEIITFTQPIYGFDHLSHYVLLSDSNVGDHFVWLQSAEDSHICFILVNPKAVLKDYAPVLPPATDKLLGEGKREFWLVVVLADKFQDSTVNLKSPVVINHAQKTAVQVILEEPLPIRHPLLSHKEVK